MKKAAVGTILLLLGLLMAAGSITQHLPPATSTAERIGRLVGFAWQPILIALGLRLILKARSEMRLDAERKEGK